MAETAENTTGNPAASEGVPSNDAPLSAADAPKPDDDTPAPATVPSSPTQAAPTPAPERSESQPLTFTARIHDRYTIDGEKPLPQFDSPCAKAYEATDSELPGVKLFALMCQPGMPIRVGSIRKLRSSRFKGVIPIHDWGYVYWEPYDKAVAAVICEQPLGGSLIGAISTGVTRVGEYDVVKRVVLPAMEGIVSLMEAGLIHRSIRPDNMFFMDETRDEIVLGECVTTPPGFDQPVMYEPIERSMAPPSGRGDGTLADDMYALGIAIVIILLGYNPLRRLSSLDIIAAKVESGTYGAVCGKARLPMGVIELLRGLMSDDEKTRWNPDQVDAWANGRKQTPMQRQGQKKATSPYTFDKQGHLSPRTLAYAFAAKYEEAFKTLKADDNFEGWLRRSLGDEEMADIYKALMDHSNYNPGSANAKPDVVISRICMLLDPIGPIRYRGYALMPDALGSALAVETMVNQNAKAIVDIITQEIYDFWFKAQPKITSNHLNWQRTFVRCRGHLKSRDMGYGIERCLYELNDFIPCQSELVIEENVTDCTDLLLAMDRVSNKVETGTRPIDRHIAAYITTRFVGDVHLHLRAIASPMIERSAIGVLSLFAFVQHKSSTGPLLGLTSWVGGQVGPAINTYHSRTTRRELEREIPQVVRKGSLRDLFELIESAEKRRDDSTGFAEAQAEFAEAEAEIVDIIGGDDGKISKVMRTAQKVTAMSSILVSMAMVTMLFMLNVF